MPEYLTSGVYTEEMEIEDRPVESLIFEEEFNVISTLHTIDRKGHNTSFRLRGSGI